MTPKRKKFLEVIERTPMRLQIDATGSRIPNDLRREGLIAVCEHPTVKDAFGYPASAYTLTDAGRVALRLARGEKSDG